MFHLRIAIIGSGFGGLGTAIRLKQEGIDDFVVLERAGDVGGTWRDNTYPGCACDVESDLYSFSFAQNPGWSYRFSRQPEIWEYLQRCARDFGVMPHLRFHHEVKSVTWSEKERLWRIETSHGPFTASMVVMATGPLSEPVVPQLPGVERFEGRVFHSARWDHSFPLDGSRVAVVGTGASAIQFVPEIQKKVTKLHLFQRTPPWVIPRPDWRLSKWRSRLFRVAPFLQRLVRGFVYAYREIPVLLFRRPALMRRAQRLAAYNIHRSISDPALRVKVTPDYTMGCKRILLSSDYYPALAQNNVEVITDGIAEVRERSIVGRDGIERPVDAIILGTGFRPTDPPLARCTLGRDGRSLTETWNGSPKGHLGTTFSGFPNLFMILGPNTGLGHNSVVFMSEAQIEHFIGALSHMTERRIDAIEPKEESQAAFVNAVDARMRGTVWTAGGCASWYLDGTGRNSTLWPDFSWRFSRRVAPFDPREYVSR